IGDGLGGRLVAVRAGALIVAPAGGPQPVSLRWLRALAAACEIELAERALTGDDLARADELMLCGMPFCLLAIGALDGRALPAPTPGPITARLIAAWSADAGVDLAAQSDRLAVAHELLRPARTP
ncbi:MAG: hypothetical protein Q8O56_17240, partial [Solirubrobacteraceae bacterium]|nr:hypothetical protein [Solirubrobacteraceae bacterium]